MMQQILSMAQSLGHNAPPEQNPNPEPTPVPGIDLTMLQKLSGIAKQSGIDGNEQALLKALRPYLTRERIRKLENAMRAAKLARMASVFMNSGGLQLLTGR
jgi:hypothetical protein